MNEQLAILIKRRDELIKFILTHNLQEEKHYMKFLELQDVNLKILIQKPDYDFEEEYKKWKYQ